MFDVSLMAAFGAGLLSFASPCVLPIVPFYLSYLAGVGLNELKAMDALDRSVQRRAIISALFFSAQSNARLDFPEAVTPAIK